MFEQELDKEVKVRPPGNCKYLLQINHFERALSLFLVELKECVPHTLTFLLSAPDCHTVDCAVGNLQCNRSSCWCFRQAFVVNVIQFRNSFDSQGPGVPGVRPAEAVTRLHDFQQRFTQYDAKRNTLDSVQLLFGIAPTPFPELDKTGEVGCTFTPSATAVIGRPT